MRNILLRKLYKWIFREYHLSKDWKSKCFVSFVDDVGRKYYTFKNPFDMPINRTSYIDNLKYNYSLSWGTQEQEELEKRMIKVINSVIDQKAFSKYSGVALDVQKLLKLKEARKGRVIPIDILNSIIACYMIREDEEPSEINETVLEEKKELFKKKETRQLLDKLSLAHQFGLSEITDEQWSSLLEQTSSMDNLLKGVLSSMIES